MLYIPPSYASQYNKTKWEQLRFKRDLDYFKFKQGQFFFWKKKKILKVPTMEIFTKKKDVPCTYI